MSSTFTKTSCKKGLETCTPPIQNPEDTNVAKYKSASRSGTRWLNPGIDSISPKPVCTVERFLLIVWEKGSLATWEQFGI